MTAEKKSLLEYTYQQFMNEGLGMNNLSQLDELADPQIMGFGTTEDEKMFSLAELKTLLQRQKSQTEGISLSWEINPLYRRISSQEDTAVYADELFLHITTGAEKLVMYMRFSIVLEYNNEKWKVTHWHGSKPENVKSDEDTFGIENWKQKAEALEKLVTERTAELVIKNRELEIEASLERVRAVAMGMMSASDLLEICKVQFQELKQLGFSDIRNSLIGIFHDDNGYFTDYDFSDYSGGTITNIPYHKNKLVDSAVTRMKSSTDAFTEFIVQGEELKEWKAFRKENGEYDDSRLTDTDTIYYYFYSISSGNVGLSTFKKISEEQLNILKRFRNIFDLAYKRYVDISNADAQTKEALVEAALERVRSRSMAMHRSDELKEVIQVVFEQFIQLNIKIEHTGFVMDYKSRNDFHSWIADRFGSPSQVTIPYFDCIYYNQFNEAKEKGIDFFSTTLSLEEKNRFYVELFEHIPGFPEESKNIIFSHPGFTISTVLLENVALYIENFSGTPFSNEENSILIRFGKVFQQTYTRFLDLQKAEAQALRAEQDLIEIKVARKKAEDAFNELQATQKQLIQSEKMASLGELTAGIAHEIQNPLNFVNNFSEVSNELIEELQTKHEKLKIADEEVNELLKDISQNLQKINHHGKRADAIVKGMLQHSRNSNGQKEMTDINLLCDEYLRLSYHGLRAKDKSFNAAFKTDFDNSIGKINIIPQDIGRVIMNLLTNAFYAVNEKALSAVATLSAASAPTAVKHEPTDNALSQVTTSTAVKYEPTVSVSTKKEGNNVLISVKDNGNGIPQNILDKIFQPFFTTKPTGQGTGLGLSMSYDIVTKGHGGELKVITKEARPNDPSGQGEGTEFIIILPTNP